MEPVRGGSIWNRTLMPLQPRQDVLSVQAEEDLTAAINSFYSTRSTTSGDPEEVENSRSGFGTPPASTLPVHSTIPHLEQDRANSGMPPRLRLIHSATPYRGLTPAAPLQTDSPIGARLIQLAAFYRGHTPPSSLREQSTESNVRSSTAGGRPIATPRCKLLPLTRLQDQSIESDLRGSPVGARSVQQEILRRLGPPACLQEPSIESDVRSFPAEARPTELAKVHFGLAPLNHLRGELIESDVPSSPAEARPFQTATPQRGLLPPVHVRELSIESTSSLSSINSMCDPFIKQEENSSFNMSQLPEAEQSANRRSARLNGINRNANEPASASPNTADIIKAEDGPEPVPEPEETEVEKKRRICRENRRSELHTMGFNFYHKTVHRPGVPASLAHGLAAPRKSQRIKGAYYLGGWHQRTIDSQAAARVILETNPDINIPNYVEEINALLDRQTQRGLKLIISRHKKVVLKKPVARREDMKAFGDKLGAMFAKGL